MALINDFKKVKLETKFINIGLSGAQKNGWKPIGDIEVALYETGQLTIYQSLKTEQYDYAGFSFCSELKCKRGTQRLIVDDEVYSIEKPVRAGLVTYFLLKKVQISERQ